MPDLIGQQQPLAAALSAVRRGRVAHAQLIVGPAGSGKGVLAETIARAQWCTDPLSDGLPCGACRACTLALAGAHPDLHWVGPEGRLGIDEARHLGREAVLSPHSSSCAVFVVEASERLTGPAAAALLKTLEDPVGRVLFLLLADHPDQIEPTLRSRCLQMRLRPVQLDVLLPWLAEMRPDQPEALRREAARGCRGWPGQALRLLDGPPDEERTIRLCAALMADSQAERMKAAAALAAGEDSPEECIAMLRDAWALQRGLVELTPASPASPKRLAELSGVLPVDFAKVAAAAMEARLAEDANVNTSLNWQVLLHRLRRASAPC